jgi:GntR family transcriptional regulator, rspAB operon transcriptional repressor
MISIMPISEALVKGRKKMQKKNTDPSLTEQAYQAIKGMIISSEFAPGQYLTEAQVRDAVNLGRTPVHQGLLRLEVEGLVEIVPRKGVVIQRDSVPLVIDVIETRMLVEGEVMRKACRNVTNADIDRLFAITEQSKEYQLRGLDVLVDADAQFHRLLSEIAASESLSAVVQMLHERSRRAWYLHLWQTLDSDLSLNQHNAIIEALSERNEAKAVDAMVSHLDDIRERLMKIQKNSPLNRR